jgi:hypothetical protein
MILEEITSPPATLKEMKENGSTNHALTVEASPGSQVIYQRHNPKKAGLVCLIAGAILTGASIALTYAGLNPHSVPADIAFSAVLASSFYPAVNEYCFPYAFDRRLERLGFKTRL